MFAVAAVVCFAVALILELAGIGKGHVDWLTFELAGLLGLALAGISPWPWRR